MVIVSNYDLNVKGLMCLPPINENPALFLKLKELGEIWINKVNMGMSNDTKEAINVTHKDWHIFGKRN